MRRAAVKDFYRIQKERTAKSRGLYAVLLLFYVVAIGAIILSLNLAVGLILARSRSFSAPYVAGVLVLAFVFAALLAAFQFADARRNGAAFILKRLSAKLPQILDRYHRRLADVVEEMRIAAGLETLKAYVIPDHAVNSMALVEADGTPVIAMTEGLLAEFTRDELAAAAAHEAAHITRGDTIYLTLICSLADFFERLSDRLGFGKDGQGPENPAFSAIFIRLLTRFIGREREILADAAAVEFCRDPVGLARALYKAHLRNSFVGDFAQTYAPLFIVSPRSRQEGEEASGGWTGTHPPLMTRIRLLAEMANLKASDIIRQVWESRMGRELAKEIEPAGEDKPVRVRPSSRRSMFKGRPNECPRCEIPLAAELYEGVSVRICRKCGGKLVDQEAMNRILTREEVGFTPELRKKAEEFRQRFWRNPIKTLKLTDRLLPAMTCPACGYPLKPRPYNYQYFVPVEKCLSCNKIWFDTDELEVLQILVEEAKGE